MSTTFSTFETTRVSVPVSVRAWGATEQDVETAVSWAGFGSARAGWDFVDVDRSTESACPIDVRDPKVIAADCGLRWAYAVYPAERTDG